MKHLRPYEPRLDEAFGRAEQSKRILASHRRSPLERGLGDEALFDRLELREEIVGELFCCLEIAHDGSRHRLAALLSRGLAERVEDLGDGPLQIFDVSSHEKELPLNLLDGVVLRHHVSDALNLA